MALLRTTPKGDHFADVSEMVLDAVSAVETGQFGLLDHGFEIPVLPCIPEPRPSRGSTNIRCPVH